MSGGLMEGVDGCSSASNGWICCTLTWNFCDIHIQVVSYESLLAIKFPKLVERISIHSQSLRRLGTY